MSAARRQSSAEPSRSRAPSLVGPGLGQAVEVQGGRGIVRFCGATEFATGRWFGVELEGPYGKNDGSVKGKRYFECQPDYGVFVRSSQVKLLTSSAGPDNTSAASSSAADEGGAGRSRATIHGAEIQTGEQRLRPPMTGILPPTPGGADVLKAARRATMLPGRSTAYGGSPAPALTQASSIAPPAGLSRLGGSLAQRAAPASSAIGGGGAAALQSARRISDVQNLGPRRATLSGVKSPAFSAVRSSSRQTVTSESGSGASRPNSREHFARLREESPTPSAGFGVHERSETPRTPTKNRPTSRISGNGDAEPSDMLQPVAEELPRTPYRPALSMNESSTFDSTGPATTMSSQTVSLKQFEELRLKYKFLEQKRSEDRQRIQEAERIRSEAEQALRVRDKLAAKVGTQQEEVKTLKQRLREITTEHEELEAKHAEATECLDMLAVDKEMAEERLDSVMQVSNALREELDDAKTRLEVYKSEGDHSALLSSNPNSATVLEYIQLQKQNERIKNALRILSETTTANETELNSKIKQLEQEAMLAQELLNGHDDLKEKLLVAETHIEDLKERLDDALGAEEMIETLTVRNLDLNHKVEELQSAVENLEALCEVNNEMEDARADDEKVLRAEIERLTVVIGDRTRRIDKLEEAVADYQFNIGQYRDLVASQQADLQNLRESEHTQASRAASESSKAQEMLSRNLRLESSMTKTKAKAIDLEVRRLDADQAAELLTMYEPFLPDHFFKSESEALRSLLSFKRLAAKSEILCKQLEQDEKADTSISDDFVATAEIRSLLTQFASLSSLFVHFLSSCTDMEFMRLASLLHDTQGAERRLNGLIDILRKEEFRATEALPEIRRLAAQLNGLVDAHIPADARATAAQRLDIKVSRLAFGSDIQLSNLFYIEQLLVSGPTTDRGDSDNDKASVFLSADRQRIASEVVPSVASVIQNCKASKAAAIKLLRRSKELKGAGMAANSNALEAMGRVEQQCNQLVEYSVRTRTVIQDYFAVSTSAGSSASVGGDDSEAGQGATLAQVSFDQLQQDINNVAQDVFGANDAMPLGLALNASQQLTKELTAALALISDSDTVSKMEVCEAPWIKRAAQFKASLVQNADVERRTEALNEEIVSLARKLRLRDQAIQEFSVKTEMLEKRTETMRRQAEQVAELQRLLEAAKSKELTYEEAIESLQGEMDTLERECRKLKQASAAAKTAALAGDFSAIIGPGGGNAPLPSDLLGLRSKIGALQESVSYLRKENAHLRAKYMFKEESRLMAAHPLTRSLGTAGSSALSEAAREAKTVAREACRLAAMPKLVKLGAVDSSQPPRAWQPMRSRPQFDLYRQQALAQTLKQRAESVQERLRGLARYPALSSGVYHQIAHTVV
ncbi:hypothetical protein GGH94_003303 [Coemansia aciculifera]|uniref:CAP-Gly domain-containing protein n=1 Tax=Coemansia aciculifera TaxID=417176 RepID=A0A9W8M6D9_9FUNG|nr:hypothetical protein GGH94_003303 [Coemansia aciculifera]KAJ2873398.1 hypothetical protein GGH93_003262 [Coemansia aciculifera]